MCPGALGAVGDDERVARLFITQVPYQGYQWLARGDLLPPGKRSPSDACGEADGVSVDRCSALSDAELVRRSLQRMEEKNAERVARGKQPTQHPGGARVASAGRLRALRRQAGESARIVFVYDDARDDNDEHAVVRLSDTVPEEEVAGLLDDIRACFDAEIAAG